MLLTQEITCTPRSRENEIFIPLGVAEEGRRMRKSAFRENIGARRCERQGQDHQAYNQGKIEIDDSGTH